MMRTLVMGLALGLTTGVAAVADTVLVEATRDATLIEDPEGASANGSGPALFAGRTSQGGIRRGLISFDVAGGVLPPGAIVEEATLEMYAIPGNAAPRAVRLHRALDYWEEGPSASSGGGGATSRPGDVTWIHTVYDTDLWVRPGGQFVPHPSATTSVAEAGFYTWPGLVRDVNLWARTPGVNHGWIVTGDETTLQTAKAFASREGTDASQRPRLRITFRTPGGTNEP